MEIVFTVLILLLAVGISGLLARLLPFRLPLPLVQIVIGAALAWPGFRLKVAFDPELFMLLFIPPLLFADGWRIPKREFFRQRRAILTLAFGLVFLTVLAVGYFAHLLIPALPLPVAFALAAVLSPTDAVALSAIAGKKRMPASLMHILEGEALLNDASGLVALKFAIAAALTGVFVLHDALVSFVLIAAGGLGIGIAVSWVFSFVAKRVLAMVEEGDPAPGIVMQLLVPFAAYLFAEHFKCSGVLAAVASGMAMNFTGIEGTVASRLRAVNTWSMIEFVFNGMVFILLGLQLPGIIGNALINAHRVGDWRVFMLLCYVVATLGALYAMRFAWVWVLRRVARRDFAGGDIGSSPRLCAVTTIAGVRGAITLAGVLSLPRVLGDGTPLPGRDLAIFIASGVILGSLLVAAMGLPLLLRGLRAGADPRADEERQARILAAQAAIRSVDEKHMELTVDLDEAASADCADVVVRVRALYLLRLAALGADDKISDAAARRMEAMELQMRIAALRAERATLYQLLAKRQINNETLNKLMREIDLSETTLVTRGKGHLAA